MLLWAPISRISFRRSSKDNTTTVFIAGFTPILLMALMVILGSLQQSAISGKNKMLDAKIVEQFLMVYEICWTD